MPPSSPAPSQPHHHSLGSCSPGTDAARRLGLLPVDSPKQGLQLLLERLVLGSLVELADEVAAVFEGVACELKCGVAEVLCAQRQFP